MKEPLNICTKCVMDTTDPDISFNEEGVCNYCSLAEEVMSNYNFSEEEEKKNLAEMAELIQKNTGKSGYDSILGLSGGVDSSYVALLAKEMGLNPLCVHFDNGWNSEAAVANINKVIDHCGYELYTYVINWEEFRDLQRSFIKAGVIDLELLSDHAIFASLFKLGKEFKIKYVLSGTNFATENGLPSSWIWSKMDFRNIKDIHRKYGSVPLKSFPSMSSFKWGLIRALGIGGTFLEPLNNINYSKTKAMSKLESIGWRYYGGKHYESLITKFYQGYILPKKFGVDKRKSHHSALIRNNELTRDEAINDLKEPPLRIEDLELEKKFICKKLGFSESEFDEYMNEKPRRHDDFKTDRYIMQKVTKVAKIFLRKS
ncbi:MAG: N-acetyl sugar amidotransferase [Rickettsiales bacterium TMED289]|nr:MAG: N-acetyl sugar amidotransferase [Rickettsiales bacterium TMED289]